MNLAILHHHLNRGGVTQVIANHLRSLDEALHARSDSIDAPIRVALVHGGRRNGWQAAWETDLRHLTVEHLVVEELDYDEQQPSPRPMPEALAAAILEQLAAREFAATDTLLHIHNHSLGKNVSLPGAIRELAAGGVHLLLQIHDFAEDYRPENYRRLHEALASTQLPLAEQLYPQASRIHYAVLNSRDHELLEAAGVAPTRLHLLPNPVTDHMTLPPRDVARSALSAAVELPTSERLTVYPVRGIRRKNLGEMLLWAALAPAGERFAVTLAPQNPREQTAYQRWQKLAERFALPCLFGLGDVPELSFGEIIAGADRLLTTSVAEGFGMVFLEAQLQGKILVGRDLPEITNDFSTAGLVFPFLASQLLIPVELLDQEAVIAGIEAAYIAVIDEYGLDESSDWTLRQAMREFTESLRQASGFDFAMLSFDQQQQVVEQVATDDSAAECVREANDWLAAAWQPGSETDRQQVSENAAAVVRSYAPRVSGERLLDCYAALTGEPPSELESLAESALILRRFLAGSRSRQIRNQPD